MNTKRYKPKIDRLFWIIATPSLLVALALTVIPAIFHTGTLFITLPTLLFIAYFLVSPLFGYVELREKELFIKYGFFMRRAIPYTQIRTLEKKKGFYSESMLSLKNAFEHVNVKYNNFDVTTVSVEDNDGFVERLNARINECK